MAVDIRAALKQSYAVGVRYGATKYQSVVGEIPERFRAGLRAKFGRDPKPELVEKLRAKTSTMASKYQAFASNADAYADRWLENWAKAVFGTTL